MSRALHPILALLLLAGCGAAHPFQRGEAALHPSSATSPELTPGPGPVESDALAKSLFANELHPLVQAACLGCHQGMEGSLNLKNEIDPDHAAFRARIQPGSPEASLVYNKVQGQLNHGGGEVWAAGSPELAVLKRWIEAEK